ncbi:MAG: FKBP-type peptidyl-prolyl cis-trans isomerase [Chitinophagaceae bacterium]|nr:FKBP-type peptidyl-prolyl cis-trans isomerase [Chitinophagaceae bacterium]
MKYSIILLLLHYICIDGFCQNNRSAGFTIPDSIKATGYYAEVNIAANGKINRMIPGIRANGTTIGFGNNKKNKSVEFFFTGKKRKAVSTGTDVTVNRKGFSWKYEWKPGETYPLLIMSASDSASHTTIFSGYIFLPADKKWKLIATCSYEDTARLRFISLHNNTGNDPAINYSNRWLLRSNNTWKALDSQRTKPPVLRPFSNIDSIVQQQIEEKNLTARFKDSITFKEGIFYQVLKEGTGKQVLVTDTVIIHYKGWLFSNGSVFDETKEKPATFPLNRLIRGWQVGVPQCRVGGKIRLYIPSGSAYGIRTFATDIPPNSTLVFDVEVLEAKEKLIK